MGGGDIHPGLPRMVWCMPVVPALLLIDLFSISVVSLDDKLCGHPNCELFKKPGFYPKVSAKSLKAFKEASDIITLYGM